MFSKNFFKNILLLKINSSNQFCTKNFHQKSRVQNFLMFQNHFLENRFEPKIFINIFGRNFFRVEKSFLKKQLCTKIFFKKCFWKIFYCCKIISSKQFCTKNCHQKFRVKKFFIVPKSFPRKQVSTENFH